MIEGYYRRDLRGWGLGVRESARKGRRKVGVCVAEMVSEDCFSWWGWSGGF